MLNSICGFIDGIVNKCHLKPVTYGGIKMKFLFTMESIGMENWIKRKEIVNEYFKVPNTFIRKGNPISKADFDLMLYEISKR